MENYRWNNPHEWLQWKVANENKQWSMEALVCIMSKLDPDDIQEIFQEEMDQDGYFKPTN